MNDPSNDSFLPSEISEPHEKNGFPFTKNAFFLFYFSYFLANPPTQRKKHEKSKLIAKRFLIQKRLGVGTFGRVYLAIDIENKQNYAIKIQKKMPDKRKLLLLQKETEIVRDLSNEEGFPKLKIFFKEKERLPGYVIFG